MRLRFAPSPTGYLHIGNARTALCNHVIARKYGAELVLRIEDTDLERSSRESERSILEDLKWLGIEWHEGPDIGGDHGPYRQSERFDIYNRYTETLLKDKKAYYCYCSPEELDAMRDEATRLGRPYTYDGRCRDLTDAEKERKAAEGRKPTVRFRVPEGESITVNDLIKGKVFFESENIGGDFIIVRSDGTPVYNYIVIIDDTLMGITHVIRGEDHLPNTPKQILIARALGLPVPEYAHLALVLGPDRAKLSKRHGMTSVEMYRREGYLPEALVNYLSLLGWASDTGEEILSMEQIAGQIEIGDFGKSAAVFDFQKLKWMNGHYIRNHTTDMLTDLFIPYLSAEGYDPGSLDRNWLEKVVDLVKGNCETLAGITKPISMFLKDVPDPDDEADAVLKEEDSRKLITGARDIITEGLDEHGFAAELVRRLKEKTGLKGKKLFFPLRAMLTGSLQGPELDQALPLIGFEKCRKRIEYCHVRYAGS